MKKEKKQKSRCLNEVLDSVRTPNVAHSYSTDPEMSLSPSSRFSSVFGSSVALSRDSSSAAAAQDPLKLILGSPNFGSWKGAISSAESLAPGPSADPSDYLVLAAHRTKRPDILTAFKPYIGGWNITNNLLGICWIHRCSWFHPNCCLDIVFWLSFCCTTASNEEYARKPRDHHTTQEESASFY